ncbi:MAG TPA: zinc-binding dehydrogenase, partial [Acidimicrobiia bacterium]
FYLSCGSCSECLAGREQRCTVLKGWVGVHCDGGYAPLCALPARNVIPVSSDLDPVTATVIPDAVATPVHVAARAGIEASDLVVVIGAGGGVGSHMIQVARLHGAEVVGLDVGEQKLQSVADLGARPLSSASFSELSGRIGGRAPTLVIDLVGSAESIEWGRAALEPGGRQVLLTTYRGQSFPLSPRQMVSSELTVLGSRYATRAEVATAARLVESGNVSPVIGRVVSPEEAPQVHIQLRRGALLGRGAIDWRSARDRAQ